LFEAFFRYLITQRGVSFGTAADYCERLRMFFMRAGLFDEASLAALANLAGALTEEATDSDPGKWTKLRAFRKHFTLSDLLHAAIAAAQEAGKLPGHTTAALRLRQKAVSYALLVNTGDRQGDLRHFEIGVDLIRDAKGDWHHAIRTSKTGRIKEVDALWPGTSKLIDAHILGDRPAWMIARRVAELQDANLLTLTDAVVNEGFINLRLKDDFKIHGHLVRTLLTDLMRRERPDARWAAQHMLGHEDRYMQETYRSDFAESGAIQAMAGIDKAATCQQNRSFVGHAGSSPLGGQIAFRFAAEDQPQHGHPHGQAVGYLFQDRRMSSVGHVGGHLHAAVDRARGEDQDVVFCLGQPLPIHGVQMGILADRGERPGKLPLELDPQQVQHVDPRQDLVEAVGILHADLRPTGRNQRRRAADDHMGTER
ncbi:hypothetical protein LCGC14_2741810, partial [marine sediment metagenome]